MPSKLWINTWRWGPLHLLLLVTSHSHRPEITAGWQRSGRLGDGPWLSVDFIYGMLQVEWNPVNMRRVGKKRAGRLLDGVEHNKPPWGKP